VSELLRPGTTYLPIGFSQAALAAFGLGETALLLEELEAGGHSYERVGVDRVLAIAGDLALRGLPPDARILDVGCSTGTISVLLAALGYRVTGIDNDVVTRVQEWQDTALIESARRAGAGGRCRLLKADLREYLDSRPERCEVGLLLSVLHHWLAGYGYTGEKRFEREEMRVTLRRLCEYVRECIYLEVPIADEYPEMPPDPEGEFLFPGWFLSAGLASDIRLIASTVASNGKPRRLYRIDLA
jgi:SAM-dependent methyltransferase